MPAASTPAVTLERIKQFASRPLSWWEYFQACSGTHPQTLEGAREIFFVCEGEGKFDRKTWQLALDQAIAANPACRIRMAGKRQRSHWLTDGEPPSLRVITDSQWQGDQHGAAEITDSAPFSLGQGPTSELILVEAAAHSYVVFRAHHAVMDGLGIAHFLQEVFRALRGEPLLGTNATFSDTELTADIPPYKTRWFPPPCAPPNGDIQGEEKGNSWRRLSLSAKQSKLLARTILAVAEYAARFSDKPTRIAVPVSLRRYRPEIVSTMNYTSIMYLDIDAGDTVDSINHKIKSLLEQHAEVPSSRLFKLARYLPLPWFDLLTSRSEKNYLKGIILQTAFISNLGVLKSEDFCGGGFTIERLFGLPLQGICYIVLSALDGKAEMTIGLPDVYGSNGRLDDYTEFFRQRLSVTVDSKPPSETAPPIPEAKLYLGE